MNRVTQMVQGTYAAGGININYSYDDAGRLTTVGYANREMIYEYSAYDHIRYIKLDLDASNPSSTVHTVREYWYAYKDNSEDLDYVGGLDYTKDYRNFINASQSYIKTDYTKNGLGLTVQLKLLSNIRRNNILMLEGREHGRKSSRKGPGREGGPTAA